MYMVLGTYTCLRRGSRLPGTLQGVAAVGISVLRISVHMCVRACRSFALHACDRVRLATAARGLFRSAREQSPGVRLRMFGFVFRVR